MNEYILSHESVIRVSIFFGLFAAVCMAEVFYPRKKLTLSRSLRWPNNIGLVFFNTILLRFLIYLLGIFSAVQLASLLTIKGYGLFNLIDIPYVLKIILSVIILDCVVYWQHVLFHKVGFLWKLHRMHHADVDYDVTLGSRFHPIEIILSMGIKFFFITLLGAPAAAVILFEVILNGMAMFNHGNFKLPLWLDRYLRVFIVTPDFHRVHHSTFPKEFNSNFGFNLPWWDKIFKTYVTQPHEGHEAMRIGLNEFREESDHRFFGLLKIPFRK